jgi:hypothetical protein
MSNKRPSRKGPEQSGPKQWPRCGGVEIDAWVSRGGLEPYEIGIQEAARRLLSLKPWPASIQLYEFQQSVYAYSEMAARDAWDQMTQREREIWKERFESVTTEFLDLIQRAPCPPENFGFPIRDVLLMHTLKFALARDLPELGTADWWREMRDVESAFDRSGVNLTHAISHFRQQQRADWGPEQSLAKPRDIGSDRVFFSIELWRHTELEDRTIADIATQMLEKSVEAADVYRWTVGYSKRRRQRISEKSEKSSFTDE